MVNWFLIKVPGLFNSETIVSSTNGVGTTGCPYAKERSWSPTSHYAQKLIQNGLKDLKTRCETIQLLEENVGNFFFDSSLSNTFLDVSLQERETKTKTHHLKELQREYTGHLTRELS